MCRLSRTHTVLVVIILALFPSPRNGLAVKSGKITCRLTVPIPVTRVIYYTSTLVCIIRRLSSGLVWSGRRRRRVRDVFARFDPLMMATCEHTRTHTHTHIHTNLVYDSRLFRAPLHAQVKVHALYTSIHVYMYITLSGRRRRVSSIINDPRSIGATALVRTRCRPAVTRNEYKKGFTTTRENV